MNIDDKKVVSFHYTLKNDQGEELESSLERGSPMTYLHGTGNIIPGLEKAMAGKAAGDKFEVTVEPVEAYGERNEAAIQRVPAKHFGEGRRLEPGQLVILNTKQGPRQVTV
jgi:FKBP-type peptidyl-prolyl cis-trans isomerase SlyD